MKRCESLHDISWFKSTFQKTMKFHVLLLTLSGLLSVINAEAMGPFEAVLQSLSSCPSSKSGKKIAEFSSHQEKVSRKKFNLFLDLYLSSEVTDKYTLSVNVAKKTPQGWKENFFQLDPGPLCGALKKYVPDLFMDVTKGLKLKKNECPLPAGNYTNMPIRTSVNVKAIPAFFYTTVKVRGTIYDKSEVVACLDVQVETIAKKP